MVEMPENNAVDVKEKQDSHKDMLFSFSRLKMFEECPFRFFKKYIEGYEEPTTLPLALGKAVHKAIEDKIKGLDHHIAIQNGYVESGFHSQLTYDEISDLVNRARLPKEPVQTEMYFELPLENTENAPKIRGYIDVIGEGGKFITDWKTNRKMYRVTENHQVGIYAWVANQIYGATNVVGTLYFLRYRKASTHIYSLMDMENARIWALNLAKTIRAKVELYEMIPQDVEQIFPSQPGANCKHCPFVKECYNRFGTYLNYDER